MLPEERFERFVELQRQGRSLLEIALALGVTTRTVTRWRARIGVSRQPAPRYPQNKRDEAARFLEDGCSISETARSVGVAEATIVRWFPNAPRWTKSDASKLTRLAERSRVFAPRRVA